MLGVLVGALLLALLPLEMLVPLLILVGIGLLALLDPVFGLYAAVLSVPIQQVLLLPGGLTYTQAAMILALGAWLLRLLAHPERRGRRPALLVAWLCLIWVLLLAAASSPYSTRAGLIETSRWIVALVAFVLVVDTVSDRRRALGLLACVLLAPALTAALGLRQFVTGDGPPSFRIAGGFVRAYGTLGTANALAGYLNMAWPLAAALGLWLLYAALTGRRMANGAGPAQRGRLWLLLFVAATGALSFAGLLASFSRGAWLGALAGGLVMTALAGRRAAIGAGVALALGMALLVAGEIDLLPDVVRARVASISANARIFDASKVRVTPENFAIVERMAHWQAGVRMLRDYPLLGVGPGGYNLAYREYFVNPWRDSRGHAHNYYVHIAAEAGLLGLTAYMALLGGLLPYAVRALRATRAGIWRAISVGCCGAICAVMVHNVFENLHVLNLGIQLAAIWGLLVLIPALVGDATQ